MNHDPTLDGATYHCPACAWRAVLATDRRIIQVTPGDAGHDHIGQARQQQAEATQYCARIIARLRTLELTEAMRTDLIRKVIGEFR